jgi:hypothetical protein
MLNRSKIVIDVGSFILAQMFRVQLVQQDRMPVPKSRVDGCVNYQEQTSPAHHAAPCRFQMVTFGHSMGGAIVHKHLESHEPPARFHGVVCPRVSMSAVCRSPCVRGA